MTCTVPGCGRKDESHGLCQAHRRRLLRTGDVQAGVPIGAHANARGTGGRFHHPDACCYCVELPHLAQFGYPVWWVAERLGVGVPAIEKHLRDHPELAARLPRSFLAAIQPAIVDRRKTRQKETA